MPLGRDCRWLLCLRLETKIHHPLAGRLRDDGGVFHVQRVVDVGSQRGRDGRDVVADEAGLLTRRDFRLNFCPLGCGR